MKSIHTKLIIALAIITLIFTFYQTIILGDFDIVVLPDRVEDTQP